MKRELAGLADKTFDLLVIGGGIYGACVAWEATLRGLSVALVEKSDFGGATSANSLKVIHGGLRYLQHADIKRARESIGERRALLQIAPHLVHILPVLMPTYGHGLKGKEVMTIGLAVNDLVGFDRNRLNGPDRQIPRGHMISRTACLDRLPGIFADGLTGGAIFYDAQVYNSERLTLSFIRSAVKAGAQAANYAEVTGFLGTPTEVKGVTVKDKTVNGQCYNVFARMVINTVGPWMNQVQQLLPKLPTHSSLRFAKAFNVITRPLFKEYAVGIASQRPYRDTDAVLDKGSRLFFIVPWRGRSMIGTEYIPYDGQPDNFSVRAEEVKAFLAEVNLAYPAAQLTLADVMFVQAGLVPITGTDPLSGSVQLAKQFTIHNHEQEDGVKGLFSVMGVKYTTARHVAEKVLDAVFAAWGERSTRSSSATTPLHDGQIEQFDTFLNEAVEQRPFNLDPATMRQLILNYGTNYLDVLSYIAVNGRKPGKCDLIAAETRYAVQIEMAQALPDVIFRRTELGTAGPPDEATLQNCAQVMGAELGWDQAQIQLEIEQTKQQFLLQGNQNLNGTKVASSSV